jgi:hypothetical protein
MTVHDSGPRDPTAPNRLATEMRMNHLRCKPLQAACLLAVALALSACGKMGPASRPGPMWGAPGESPSPMPKPSPGMETIDARDRDQRQATPPEPRS